MRTATIRADPRSHMRARASGPGAESRGRMLRVFEMGLVVWLCLSSSAGMAGSAFNPSAARSPLTTPTIVARPNSGPAGTMVSISGSGFGSWGCVVLHFTDHSGTLTELGTLSATPTFRWRGPIPPKAAAGLGVIAATEGLDYPPHCPGFYGATTSFTVSKNARGVSGPGRAATVALRTAHMYVRPASGPAGSEVRVKGTGFATFPHPCFRGLYFVDALARSTFLEYLPVIDHWRTSALIPADAASGAGNLTVDDAIGPSGHCTHLALIASVSYVVTTGADVGSSQIAMPLPHRVPVWEIVDAPKMDL